MRFHRYSQSCAQGEGATGGRPLAWPISVFSALAAVSLARAMSA